MSVATVSSKGQITLPVEARRALRIRPGDKLTVRLSDGAIVLAPVVDFLSLRGTLGPALPRDAEVAAMRDAAVAGSDPLR